MNDEEVREAVEYYQNSIALGNQHIKTLVTLAQLYLAIAGKMPEEKKYKIIGIINTGRIYFNLARQSCILAFIKREQEERDKKDGICYYCGKMTDSLAGNPGQWAVMLCHSDDPGKVKYHHQLCVSKRLELPSAKEIQEIIADCPSRFIEDRAQAIRERLERGKL